VAHWMDTGIVPDEVFSAMPRAGTLA